MLEPTDQPTGVSIFKLILNSHHKTVEELGIFVLLVMNLIMSILVLHANVQTHAMTC